MKNIFKINIPKKSYYLIKLFFKIILIYLQENA